MNGNLNLTWGSATAFENVIGGSLADTILGNDNNNVLIGNLGNDTLNGRLGGVLNGSVLLDSTKVQNDTNAVDTLFGGGDLAWFWTAQGDVIGELNNPGPETVNSGGFAR